MKMNPFSKKTAALLSCVLAGSVITALPTTAASLFTDNFDDGNSSGWTTQNGAWSVVQDGSSKVFAQTSTSEGRASAGSLAWTNYSVEADVKVDNWNGSNRTYVAGRYQDGNNYYAASLYNSGGGMLEIRKKVGGSTTTLKSAAFALQTGTWYKVKLEMKGTTINMYVNGVLKLSVTDSSLTAGGIGLVAYKTSAKFDNVSVGDTTSGSATPTPTATPTATPTVKPTAAPTATPTAKPTAVPTATPTAVPSTAPVAGAVYVAPNGTDSNPGTIGSPTTLKSAITKVAPGGTIYMRGGTYSHSSTLTIERANSGASGSRKTIAAYGTEKPVLDFSSQAYGATERGLQLFGSYWHVKGIEVKGAGDNGIFVGGNYNRIENVEVHHNRDSGLQISRYASTAAKNEWPAYNEIINVYSHDNFDPDNGEDADGFAAKLTIGEGNVFDGCIAAYNVDDGWDLYTKTDTGAIGAVTIKNSIAHHNGSTSDGTSTTNSDGNGFKLGGEKIAVNHIVTNSIAYQNKKHGFTYNSNPGSIQFKNNTAWNNGLTAGSNFSFDVGTHQFTNNLSYKGQASDKTSGTDVSSTNVWWKSGASVNAKGLVVSDADFVSLTPTLTRNADGSPNLGQFLKLTAGSDLKKAGTPSGTDIGAVFP